MKCIIVEDQPPAQRILKKYIGDIGSLSLVGTFSDPLQAMEFLKTESVDLMFLDIHLPKISGIEFLKSMTISPKVILTTAFAEFALESYELSVVDYLLKPFSFARFVMAVNKVRESIPDKSSQAIPKQETDEIFIKVGYELIKIKMIDIVFIKSDGDYTEIHLDDKRHITPETLKYWNEKLGDKHFIRIHKSYLINKAKIRKIASNQVELMNDTKLPIGRTYKDSFEAIVLVK